MLRRRPPAGRKPHVVFLRSPIVSTSRSINNEATPSVAFAYLSGYIGKLGYSFTFIDAIAEGLNKVWPLSSHPGYQCQGLTFDEILERLPAETDVVAFSSMFSGEWPVQRDLIAALRARLPHALFVAGGEHITALTEYSLRDCPALDICVRGEGEQGFGDLLEAWSRNESLSEVPGISYIDENNTYCSTSPLTRIRDIDTIPWPHWPEGYLEKFWETGKSYGVQTERDMPIIASRGCPYQCTFCSNPQMWTTRYILRDPDDLINEIKSYIARYDITALQFYDLTAITKKRWTMEFCRKLVDNGITLKWSLPSGTRSEALDTESLSELKRTNCNYLVYAPESGSIETLEKIKKRIDLDKLTESVLEAKRIGIVVRTNLIIGFPHETRWNVFETIRYGLYLAWKGADEVSINIFSPYPGTAIFNELIAQKKVTLNDEYFLALTSLNSDYTALNPLTCNPNMGPRELALYRIIFMLSNYGLGYLRYPSRILRTFRNLFLDGTQSTTVFEHRLKDILKRRASPRSSN